MTPVLTDEDLLESVVAWRNHHRQRAKAAASLGIAKTSLDHRLKVAAERGMLLDEKAAMPGFRVSRVTTVTNEAGDKVREFISQQPEIGGPFNVPEGHSIKGVSALLDASGNVTQQWVKTKEDGENPQAIADAIRAALEGVTPATPIEAPPHSESDLATVYPLADWHIGLLAWHKESGHDYDLTIAQQVIKDATGRLFASSPNSTQGVVLGLGDLLHADNFKNATPDSGNALDVDGRYPKSLRTATELVIHTISLALHKHQSVLVRILPGNHDRSSSVAVALALSLFYANEPRVTVDDSAAPCWFWSWGDVLLGAAHGDGAKMPDLPLIMASENPEAWGRTKFRHIYTGHIHTKTGIEKSGVTVESFQTPAARDAWHSRMGYGAGRSMTAITHHKTLGEILRNKVNIV